MDKEIAKIIKGNTPAISNPSMNFAVSAITARLIQNPINPKLIRFSGNVMILKIFHKRKFVTTRTNTTSAAIRGVLTRIPGTKYQSTKINTVVIKRNLRGLSIKTKAKNKTKSILVFVMVMVFVL